MAVLYMKPCSAESCINLAASQSDKLRLKTCKQKLLICLQSFPTMCILLTYAYGTSFPSWQQIASLQDSLRRHINLHS